MLIGLNKLLHCTCNKMALFMTMNNATVEKLSDISADIRFRSSPAPLMLDRREVKLSPVFVL